MLAFWDDVATLARARELLGHVLFRGEQGVGSPGRPVLRRDKDVRSWYMTAARFVLYLLDALRLSAVVAKLSATHDADIIIFDRYLYDELANLDLSNRLSRAYVRLLLKFIPHPKLACLLDADSVLAHKRKPEYCLDFVRSNRASYLALSTFAGGITVIPPLAAEEVTRRVLQEIAQKLPGNPGLVSRDLLTSR
ncbi:MAG: thymidylate kinase [Terriglobales bacterium]